MGIVATTYLPKTSPLGQRPTSEARAVIGRNITWQTFVKIR